MLVLISGLPGSGKSTVARLVAARLNTPAYSRDWARTMLDELSPWPSRLIDAAFLRAFDA